MLCRRTRLELLAEARGTNLKTYRGVLIVETYSRDLIESYRVIAGHRTLCLRHRITEENGENSLLATAVINPTDPKKFGYACDSCLKENVSILPLELKEQILLNLPFDKLVWLECPYLLSNYARRWEYNYIYISNISNSFAIQTNALIIPSKEMFTFFSNLGNTCELKPGIYYWKYVHNSINDTMTLYFQRPMFECSWNALNGMRSRQTKSNHDKRGVYNMDDLDTMMMYFDVMDDDSSRSSNNTDDLPSQGKDAALGNLNNLMGEPVNKSSHYQTPYVPVLESPYDYSVCYLVLNTEIVNRVSLVQLRCVDYVQPKEFSFIRAVHSTYTVDMIKIRVYYEGNTAACCVVICKRDYYKTINVYMDNDGLRVSFSR